MKCWETVAVEGDGIDNDCDGIVDEEIRDRKDNDGDGFIDEDTGLVRASSSAIFNHYYETQSQTVKVLETDMIAF